MNTISNKIILVLFSIFSIILVSCTLDQESTSDSNYMNFDFKTTKEIKVSVSTLNSQNQPMKGVTIQIYTQNPLTPLPCGHISKEYPTLHNCGELLKSNPKGCDTRLSLR